MRSNNNLLANIIFLHILIQSRENHKSLHSRDIPSYHKNEYKINKHWDGVSDKEMELYEDELGFHTLIIANSS